MNQVTLGELAVLLKNCEENCHVKYNFPDQYPTWFRSYRGYYDQIALGHSSFDYDTPVTRDILLERTIASIGMTLTGYKGGQYVMTADTPIWVANASDPSGYALTRVQDTGYDIILHTVKIT